MRSLMLLLFSTALFFNAFTIAKAGVLHKVPSRDGVKVSLFWEQATTPRGTVMLFPGGGGGFGEIVDGRATSRNFLVRSYSHFLDAGYNVAIFGRPNDSDDLDYADRISSNHLVDIATVQVFIKQLHPAPIWLVGTSRGTIAATHAMINIDSKSFAGLVLTASVVNFKKTGAIPTQALHKITNPVLVLHHSKDACIHCRPHEISGIIRGLKNAKFKSQIMLDGGHSPTGDVCAGQHYHGFINFEKEAVAEIINWMVSSNN